MKKNTLEVEQKKERAYPEIPFREWIELLEEELPKYFGPEKLTSVKVCPGCDSDSHSSVVFKKQGFNFHRCSRCDTMYVSPRPSQKEIDEFYKKSQASHYWYDEMFTPSLSSRTLHTIDPLARWAGSIINRFLPDAKRVLDYRPIFSIAVREDFPVKAKPYVFKSLYEDFKGKARIVKELRGLDPFDIVIAFDDFDRTANVSELIGTLSSLQKRGGLLFLSANTSSGFEYQVLGEHSPRLVVPDRLNLLSIEAMKKKLEQHGYKVLDISTPNKLDVAFVLEHMDELNASELPYFLKYLFTKRDESVLQSFQDFLQLNHLTSYCRIAAQKIK